MTTSIISEWPMPGVSITLMVRPSGCQMTASASMIFVQAPAVRRSKCSSMSGGMSLDSTSWRRSWRLTAMPCTWAALSSSSRSISGSLASGAASAASAAMAAACNRSFNQVTRKLAMEGTKIRISASITKPRVSSSSLVEMPSPVRGLAAVCTPAAGWALSSPSRTKAMSCLSSRRQLNRGNSRRKPRTPVWLGRSSV